MGAKVLPSGPCQLIQQAKFIYSPLANKKEGWNFEVFKISQ